MRTLPIIVRAAGAFILLSMSVAALADDPARRACHADAVRLCPAEVHSLNRRRVELCLWARVNQTTPVCHAMILTIHAQRAAAASRAP